MKFKSQYFFFVSLFFFSSCEKEIDLSKDIPPYQEKIVIEGCIENGDYPWVCITKNYDYLSEINLSILNDLDKLMKIDWPHMDIYRLMTLLESSGWDIDFNSTIEILKKFIVTGANIFVSDGYITDTLELRINPEILQGRFAYPPIKYVGKIKGEAGKSYFLKVMYDNKEYTAATRITKPITFDSIWFEEDKKEKPFGYLKTIVKDDPDEKNYYRIFTKYLSKDLDFISSPGSLQSDHYFNGKKFVWTIYGKTKYSRDPQDSQNMYNNGMFKTGDTVIIKFCTMNKEYFMFWESLSGASGSFFSEPAKIRSNIEGGGFGVWGGYGVTKHEVICEPEKNLIQR